MLQRAAPFSLLNGMSTLKHIFLARTLLAFKVDRLQFPIHTSTFKRTCFLGAHEIPSLC